MSSCRAPNAHTLWQPLPGTRDGFVPIGAGPSLVAVAPGAAPQAVRWAPPRRVDFAQLGLDWSAWVDKVLAARTLRSLAPQLARFAVALDDGLPRSVADLGDSAPLAFSRLWPAVARAVTADQAHGLVGTPAQEVLRLFRWWAPEDWPASVRHLAEQADAAALSPNAIAASSATRALFWAAWQEARPTRLSLAFSAAPLLMSLAPLDAVATVQAGGLRRLGADDAWLDLEVALLEGDLPEQVVLQIDGLQVGRDTEARVRQQVAALLRSPRQDEVATPPDLHLAALRLQLRTQDRAPRPMGR